MRIKRTIAMLLSVITLIGGFSAYAMTEKEAYDRATSFGWVDPGHAADENVTRAEFAEMVIKFAGLAPGADTTTRYDDVASGDARLPYINAAADADIIAPYLNNKFDPDGNVTKQQAAKAMLTVLGYKSWAENAGGYPTGYVTIALSTSMFDGVPGELTKIMTYGEITRVLANSAVIPLCEPTVEKGIVVYKKNENKTILSEVYDAYKIKAQIVANGVTSLIDEYTPEGSIKIRTTAGAIWQMDDGGTDVGNYVGYNATIYYRDIDGTETVMYIIPDTSMKEITISNADIDSYDKGRYTYYEDGKRKTARVASNADVIYNGKLVTDVSAFRDISYLYRPRDDKDVVKDGTVRLISTDGSDYDIVYINAMECYAVDHYSASNDAIYLKDNKGSLDVEYEKSYDIYDIDGNEIELTSLAKWDIIEVYRSLDGSYSRYVIVRDTVEGTVTSIRTGTAEHGDITIDGVTYPYDDNGKISIGTTGVFLLSSAGRVIMMTDEVKHNATFGYLVKAYCEDYEDMGHVRILTMEGELVEYRLASSVKLDGVKYKRQNSMPSYINNRQIITYELSGDEIKTIDTVEKNEVTSPSDLRLLYSNMPNSSATDDEKNTGLMYKKNLNCFGGKIIVNADTRIVVVPDSASGFDNYSIRNLSYLRNDGNYKKLTAYTLGTESQKADIVVQEIEGGIDSDFGDDSNIAVVEKVAYGVNARGEDAQYMRVYMNGSLIEVYGEDDTTLGKMESGRFYPLKTGDIVRYTTDANGIISGWKQTSSGWISGLDPIYVQSYGELEIPDSFERTIYGGDRRLACRAYDKVDDFLGVAVKSKLSQVVPEKGDVVYFSMNGANVYIYDKTRNKIELGSVDDIETYKSVGNDCSTIYLNTFKGEIKDVVIFK